MGKRLAAFRYAWPKALPLLAGFWFLGLTYGVYAMSAGLAWWVPVAMSVLIYTGSMEFIMVSQLTAPFHPLQTFVIALMVGARHLFYGISMLGRFRGLGRRKLYLIYAQCDEAFSINYTTTVPAGIDRGWFMFFVSLLAQSFWVTGTLLGVLFGRLIRINLQGLDFCMTAMFVTIFIEQWCKERSHVSSLMGLAVAVVCLAVFGPDDFVVFTMLGVLLALWALRGRLEGKEEQGA